jgi:hypothetical protein
MKKFGLSIFLLLALSSVSAQISKNPIYRSFPGDPLAIPSREDIPNWSNDQWWRIFSDIRVGNLGCYCPIASSFLVWDRAYVMKVGYYYSHPDLSTLPRGMERLKIALRIAQCRKTLS